MLGLIAIPVVFTKVTRFKIPEIMEVLYIIFCAGSIIFGEILDYYGKFGWWDSLLHTMSGIMFGILGYIILNTFNRYDGHNTRFSPIIMSAWTVCFTVTMGVIWEFIEFSCDEFLGTNMQQYLVGRGTLDQGEALVGHEALRDTMKDLGLDLIGSLIPAIIGYFELRRQKKGFAYMYLEKETNPSVSVELWDETTIQAKLMTQETLGCYKYWFENTNVFEAEIENSFERAINGWAKTKYIPDLYSTGYIHDKLEMLKK